MLKAACIFVLIFFARPLHGAALKYEDNLKSFEEYSADGIQIRSTVTIFVGPTINATEPGFPPGPLSTIQAVPSGDFQPAAIRPPSQTSTCYPADFMVDPVFQASPVPRSTPTGVPRRIRFEPNPDDNDNFPPDEDGDFPPDDGDNFPPDDGDNFPPDGWSGRRSRQCIICPAVFPICRCRYREQCRYIRRTCFRCAHFICRPFRNQFFW